MLPDSLRSVRKSRYFEAFSNKNLKDKIIGYCEDARMDQGMKEAVEQCVDVLLRRLENAESFILNKT